jgi:hypothetical protein
MVQHGAKAIIYKIAKDAEGQRLRQLAIVVAEQREPPPRLNARA